MTTPKEMRAQAKTAIVAALNQLGYALSVDSTYDEITNAISIALTGYGRFWSSLEQKLPEDTTHLTAIGNLAYVMWRAAPSTEFSGLEGLNRLTDLLAAAIDERVKLAMKSEVE